MKKSKFNIISIVFTLLILNSSFLIPNCMSQWLQVNNGMGNMSVYSLTYSGNNIYAGTNGQGVYLSTNNGTSWTQTSLNNRIVQAFVINGNYILAGTYLNGVYVSSDNGTTWNQTSLISQSVNSIVVYGNNIFAGADNSGVYLSTNNGTTWTQTSLNNRSVWSLAISGNNIFAGTSSTGVYLSTDNGTSWTQTSLNNRQVLSLAVNGNNIFAGTGFPAYGVYLSTNNGINWTQTSLNNQNASSLAVNGNNIFAGIYQNGVYVSNDNGASWTQRNEGLGNLTVWTFCILNNYLFAGTTQSVYRRQLGELTGIETISSEVPRIFHLSQNYPNPFNPSTKIKFALPNNGFAKLVVYDELGRELETLVNEQLNAGTYEAVWNASDFSSGIYFYALTSNGFTQTNKMVLTK